MVRYINDLLDVSRIATGKLSLQREAVDLNALIHTAVDSVQSEAEAKNLSLRFDAPAASLTVAGDATRLAQILSNLLSNACRYTLGGGSIVVSAGTDAGQVFVAIKDSGIGIEPSMQAKVFELFEQGDKSLERGNSGLGIGLTLARQLARLHEGDISVASQGTGQGSKFTLCLPLSPVQSVAQAVEKRYLRAGDGVRVLIADDNVELATGVGELLESEGYVVRVVHDGEAAIQTAMHFLPQIALLDIGMPKLNGYLVAKRLHADPSMCAIRLVAISGWGQDSDIHASHEAGFTHHLVKPVLPDVLLQKLNLMRDADLT